MALILALSFAIASYAEDDVQGGASNPVAAPPATAEQEAQPPAAVRGLPLNKVVTPYGDFCPRCRRYGVGKRPVTLTEATDAMHSYFYEKGHSIGNIRKMGRFLLVDIYTGEEIVDTVIFDRVTGRIRSIY